MKTAIIIAEYNPFHRGHQWQIQQLRELGYSHITAIMSGCFVQRGAPAIFHKTERTRLALLGGADLVVELPLPYACATAQRFAFGGAALADSMGIEADLCFGSECGDISLLNGAVDALESPHLSEAMKPHLAKGLTFAKARTLAVAELTSPEIAALLEEPNNTLSIEYMLQLRQLNSHVKPLTIPRKSVSHHENTAVEGFASASHIRSLLLDKEQESALSLVPEACADFMAELAPVSAEDRIILSRLRTLSKEQLSRLPDCSEGIENRLYQAIRDSLSLEEIWEKTKSKRYSHARIRRLCMNAFLGVEEGLHRQLPPYLRVLGFNSNGREILAALRKNGKIPASGSLADLASSSETAAEFARLEAQSVDLYNLFEQELKPCGQDFRFSPIRL